MVQVSQRADDQLRPGRGCQCQRVQHHQPQHEVCADHEESQAEPGGQVSDVCGTGDQ